MPLLYDRTELVPGEGHPVEVGQALLSTDILTN